MFAHNDHAAAKSQWLTYLTSVALQDDRDDGTYEDFEGDDALWDPQAGTRLSPPSATVVVAAVVLRLRCWQEHEQLVALIRTDTVVDAQPWGSIAAQLDGIDPPPPWHARFERLRCVYPR